jgi:hypothetical protein
MAPATRTCLDRTGAQLRQLRGKDFQNILHTVVSEYERVTSGLQPEHAAIYMDVGLNGLENIAAWQFDDIGAYITVTETQALATAQKKTTTAPKLTKVEPTIAAYHNIATAIIRFFQFQPMSPLTHAIMTVGSSLREYVRQRASSNPLLTGNDFCPTYINAVLTKVGTVMSDPTTDGQALSALVRALHISDTSELCKLATTKITAAFTLRAMAQLDRAPTGSRGYGSGGYGGGGGSTGSGRSGGSSTFNSSSRSGGGGNSGSGSGSSGSSGSTTTNRREKSTDPCMRYNTTGGCTSDRCNYTHTKTLSPAQQTSLTTMIDKANSNPKWAAKPKLVVTFGPKA